MNDGDPSDRTFAAFYAEEYQSIARAVALSFGTLELAKQATDEAFVRALEAWGRVSRMDSPAGWTYRVALNGARRMAHRESRRRTAETAAQRLSEFEHAPDLLAFHHLVAELPERQRIAVVLRYVMDMTEADIADAMGVRRGTVSATLRAALANLQSETNPTVVPETELGINHA